MKKVVLALFFLSVLSVSVVSAQQRAKDKNLAKWSFGVKGGIDYFRVEPYATAKEDFWFPFWKDYALQASWSAPFIFAEYTANHWFGVGLELGWLNYNRSLSEPHKIKGENITAPSGMYWGNTLDAVLYGSINITNLVAPYREGGWRKVSMYFNGGFGGAWYRYSTPGPKANNVSFLGLASITTAFNISKLWELFLEGQYRSYTKEDMGGYAAPGRSVDAIALLFGIRWKLGGASKKSEVGHERNALLKDNSAELLAEATAAKKIAEEGVAAANQRADELEGRVKSLENEKPKASKDDLDKAIRNLQRQIDDLRKGLKDTGTMSFENIRFKTDSKELTQESIEVLDKIVSILGEDVWITLEVIGNTDSRASEAYNQRLSDARANEVKRYLVSKGLDAAKIKATGKGESNPVASNETAEGRAKNRRVDFTIGK